MPITVRNLKKSDIPKLIKQKEHSVGHVKGLKFLVRGDANKQWLFRAKCKVCKTQHKVSLGVYPEVQLDDAIAGALAARVRINRGECLRQLKASEEKRINLVAEQAVTFEQSLNRFWPDIKAGLSDAKADQWRNTLDYYVIPKIGNEAIVNLRPRTIAEVLTQSGVAANGESVSNLWLDRPKVAQDIRYRMESIISKAIAFNELVVANPAAMVNGLKELLPRQVSLVKHHPDLKWEDAPEFWKAIDGVNSQSSKIIKMLLLTGKRLSEVTKMQWSELDVDNALWTIPWDRLLKKRMQENHRDPLAEQSLKIIKGQPNDGGLVFPNNKGDRLSDVAVGRVHRDNWSKYKITTHGLRAAIKTFFYENDQFGYANAHVEVILTHGQGALEAAYQRGDGYRRRAEMMQIWADYVTGKLKV